MDTHGIMNSKIKDSDIKISFVVAVFNIEVFVSECIESLIYQKYKNIIVARYVINMQIKTVEYEQYIKKTWGSQNPEIPKCVML